MMKQKAGILKKYSGIRLFGISRQDAIKYFFGGNAALAIVVTAIIILFLIYHSCSFFPNYKKSLSLYRLSGQEFTDHASKQFLRQEKLASLATQARAYEEEYYLGALYRVKPFHGGFKALARKKVSFEIKEFKRAKEKLESVEKDVDQPQVAKKTFKLAKQNLKKALEKVMSETHFKDVNKIWKSDVKYLSSLRASVVESIITGKTTDFLETIGKKEAQAVMEFESAPEIKVLDKAIEFFRKPHSSYKSYLNKVRKVASNNKGQLVTSSSAGDRKSALLEAARLARTAELKKRKKIEAARVLTSAPDHKKMNEPLYASLGFHEKVLGELVEATKQGYENMPKPAKFRSKSAQNRIETILSEEKDVFSFLQEKREQMVVWDHSKPVRLKTAVFSFFFGKEWVTNSSWQDFYGVLPLLAGSFYVALLAVLISVPFAVGGAIYVNRLASPLEQQVIKPVIEFIGAIPSIVLAFFGIVVLGSFIFEISQESWLSWVPGFPSQGRLMILTAGMLLAFMSIPTIFTLSEDALNNVPKAYKEASLALGATHLQTVLKVILPSCASGIIAAVLLGLGRVIGETMVVLLVMGGRIAIPTSITDPAHSMTGILAQEIGEVDEGSLHWGALFMVGVVLFVISLTLNYTAQTILRKLSRK